MISRKWLSVAAAGALAVVLAACDSGDGDDPGNGNGELSGEVLIDGSSTVEPLSSAAAELFMGENSGVNVSVGTSGTGGGFEKFCLGETDISDASRPIADDEIAICEGNEIAFEQITVGNDALSVVVHPDNPVECLTAEQLNAIWEPGSTIANWNDVPDLGVDFDQELELYGPGADSGTFDFFTDAINGEEGAIRDDYENIGENDSNGILGVEGSAGGMFFVGYSHVAEAGDRVKPLQVDGGGGCVAPEPATAQDGSYTPLARGLFIYPSDAGLAKPQVLAFVEFYINNNDAIAEAALAIPLTQEQKDEALAQVAALTG